MGSHEPRWTHPRWIAAYMSDTLFAGGCCARPLLCALGGARGGTHGRGSAGTLWLDRMQVRTRSPGIVISDTGKGHGEVQELRRAHTPQGNGDMCVKGPHALHEPASKRASEPPNGRVWFVEEGNRPNARVMRPKHTPACYSCHLLSSTLPPPTHALQKRSHDKVLTQGFSHGCADGPASVQPGCAPTCRTVIMSAAQTPSISALRSEGSAGAVSQTWRASGCAQGPHARTENSNKPAGTFISISPRDCRRSRFRPLGEFGR